MKRYPLALPASTSGAFRALLALLLCSFAFGGSARDDVPQLIFLRPICVLLLSYGLSRLSWARVRAAPLTWILAAAVVSLPALQLVPLPPGLWHALPGRDVVVLTDRAAGLGAAWRPLTLDPAATRNALAAACIPLAGFVLGLQVPPLERTRLLPVLLLLGASTAALGLWQLTTPAQTLQLYPIANQGSAIGLFANRNHQAVFLAMMVPMLAVAASEGGHAVRLAALCAVAILIPLILLTGSRSGLGLAVLGFAAIIPILHGTPGWRPASGDGRRGLLICTAVVTILVLIFGLALWFGRDEAWRRLLAGGAEADLRLQSLPTIMETIRAYFPLGAGMGSFETVFQVHEPDALLAPTVLNHAHDDWLELVVEGGIPAVLLLMMGIIGMALHAPTLWRACGDERRLAMYGRLGLTILSIEGVASLVDYPLRTPIHATLAAISLVWVDGARRNAWEVETIGHTQK